MFTKYVNKKVQETKPELQSSYAQTMREIYGLNYPSFKKNERLGFYMFLIVSSLVAISFIILISIIYIIYKI